MAPLPDEVCPTAQQSRLVGQDTVEGMGTPLGMVSGVQLAPPFVVEKTVPLEEVVSPTAQQSVVVGQEIPERLLIPPSLGSIWDAQLLPSLVVTTAPPENTYPFQVSPTAQQSELLGHDTPLRNSGVPVAVWRVQVAPPSVVATMAPSITLVDGLMEIPTAQQSELVGHDTLESSVMLLPTGRDSGVQLVPPLVVPSTVAGFPPTAQQSELLGHDTLRKIPLKPP
jgi:hypothetical protein